MFRNSSSRPAFNSSSGNFPLSAVRSRLRSTIGVSHKSLLTAAMHPASKFSFPALDPCKNSHLLGVSAVKLDAPPGLISGTNFPLLQTDIRFWHNFFLISMCLVLYCITFVHHFLVQFLPRFQDNLGILQCVRTCPKCSVASTLFSHCWCLLRAPCCCIPRTANTQNSGIANPKHFHLQDASHNVSSLLLSTSTAGIHRCGQACRQKHPPIHLMFTLAPSSIWFRPKQISPNGTTSPV